MGSERIRSGVSSSLHGVHLTLYRSASILLRLYLVKHTHNGDETLKFKCRQRDEELKR